MGGRASLTISTFGRALFALTRVAGASLARGSWKRTARMVEPGPPSWHLAPGEPVTTRNPDREIQITALLSAWRAGDAAAFDELIAAVYPLLKRLARKQLGRLRPGETLGTTGVVHEAYLRLAQSQTGFEDRRHFFAVAARAMRQLTVDHARARARTKRGGGRQPVSLDDREIPVHQEAEWILAIHQALRGLEALDPRQAQVVELRFFGGLTAEEIAETVGISVATVERDWTRARAWLRKALESARGSGS
jgi:RNA polymerase sigma factor (TIGR02999 family)